MSDEPTRRSTLPDEPFGIVSLHRFELLNNRRLLTETIDVLAEAARATPLLFIDHPVTIAALERFGLDRHFDATSFVRIPRLRFFDFVRVERRSAFVVTDSGGSQEECYYLDLPCLVHRVKTERREGLGENAVLSEMRADVLRDFLADPARFRRHGALAGRVAVRGHRRRPRAARLRLIRSPGRLTIGIACSAAAPVAGSARGCERTTASASEVGGGSTLSNSCDTPRGTSTFRSKCIDAVDRERMLSLRVLNPKLAAAAR